MSVYTIGLKLHKLVFGAALALITDFSSPAFAGKDFYKKDLRSEPIKVAQLHAQTVSHDSLTFVVHGGAKELQMAAYEVAQEFDEQGKPVALIIGEDSDKNPYTTIVQFFTKGGTQFSTLGFNDGDMDSFKRNIREGALKAYNSDFFDTPPPATGTLGSNIDSSKTDSNPALAGKGFIKKDLSDRTTEVVQLVGERLSKDRLTFVLHGGNRKLQMAAYRVAKRLDSEGVPVAFLIAPDRDTLPQTMHVDFYGNGGTRYGATVYDNNKNTIERTEFGLYEQAMKTVKEDFPQYLKQPEQN